MKASEMKKDKIKSVRYSSELEMKLKDLGFKSIQKFLDVQLDRVFSIELKDNQLIDESILKNR